MKLKQLSLITLILLTMINLSAQTPKNWYKNKFEQADSLIFDGLPRDAEPIYAEIIAKAKAERKDIELLRAINDKMVNKCYFEENALPKIIHLLKEEIPYLAFPTKNIAHSILANTYWQYYSNNRWDIHSRTPLTDNKSLEIETWDFSHLATEIRHELALSLSDKKELQGLQLEKYNSIISGDKSLRYLRPTVYDLLAHKALSVFTHKEFNINKPINAFTLSDDQFFNTETHFVKQEIYSEDSTSAHYLALKLYQELVRFHLDNNYEEALIDVELNRLKFLHKESGNAKKDQLLIKAYNELIDVATSDKSKAEVGYWLAKFFHSLEKNESTNYLLQSVETCKKVISAYPKTTGAGLCKELLELIKSRKLSFKVSRQVYPEQAFLTQISYTNTPTIFCKLAKVSLDYVLKTENLYDLEIDNINKLSFVKTWEQDLPDKADFRQHTLEMPVEGLQPGFYVMLISDSRKPNDESNVSAALINVTRLYLLNPPAKRGSVQLYVSESKQGTPLSGVEVELLDRDYDYRNDGYKVKTVATASTGKDGMVNFSVVRGSYSAVLKHGDDVLLMTDRYISEVHRQDLERERTVLFTDRQIYRPGQTIYFKGLALLCSDQPCTTLPKKGFKVGLYDVNSQLVESLEVETNEFGTFSGSFSIPIGLLNGQFSLRCQDGHQTIKIEEYKRPSFEVTIDPVRESYGFNDTVTIKGIAKAFAGYAIDNVALNFSVERKTEQRWWWYYQPTGSKVVANGSTKTGADGKFSVTFSTDDSDISNKDLIYNYVVRIDITDANGETRSANSSIRISNKPLKLNLNLAKVVKPGEQPLINIQATNLNDEKIDATYNVELWQLNGPDGLIFDRHWEKPDVFLLDKDAFKKQFPHLVYKEENNPLHWEKLKAIYQNTWKKEVANKEIATAISKLNPGYYKFEVSAKDASGNEIATEKVIRVIGKTPQAIQVVDDWVTPIKKSGEPGESIEFWVNPLSTTGVVRYELLHRGEKVKSEVLAPKLDGHIVKFKLEEKHRGGIAIQFVQVAEERSFVYFSEINVPYTNKELDIKFNSFRDKLAPGEKEEWKISIRNKLGEKDAAEMVATLYDASLDAFAPLSWESDFSPNISHGQFKWQNNMMPKLADIALIASPSINWPVWEKLYEHFRFSYNYYGGYNSYYHGFEQMIQRRKEEKKRKESRDKIREQHNQLPHSKFVSIEALQKENKDLKKGAEKGKVKRIDISGKIISKNNKKGLNNATIRLVGNKQIISSASNGKFEINGVPLRAWIEISKEGFEDEYIRAQGIDATIVMFRKLPSYERYINHEAGLHIMESEASGAPRMATRAFAGNGSNRSQLKASVVDDQYSPAPAESQEPDMLEENETPDFEVRKNFNETAFFYPHLITNEQGEIIVEFTIPEALTRWKMMGFAHTKDFKYGSISNTLITQKDVSIMANAPRFLRENDTIYFSAKVNNLSENAIEGKARLQLFDALSDKSLNELVKTPQNVSFSLPKGASKGITWQLIVPNNLKAVKYRVIAEAGTFTDGEEAVLPVLVNSKLVTESLPFMVRANASKSLRFDKMLKHKSSTLRNEAYTIEYTSNPAWYAIQAIPYLMEFPHACSEQVFSRFYANSLATKIMNSSPAIKQVFNTWKLLEPDALLSNLEKNQELKELLIQETPWVRDATSELERKRRLALLFDLNQMDKNLKSALRKLESKQKPSGGFPWFDGMQESRYITQHIVIGLAQLQHLNAVPDGLSEQVNRILSKALVYLDKKFIEDHEYLVKKKMDLSKNHLGNLQIHYLYAKSFFPTNQKSEKLIKAHDFYLGQAKEYWLTKGIYSQGMLAIAFKRNKQPDMGEKIIKSLSNRAIQSEELGMYWASNNRGYYWYESPIETHALLIEAYTEIGNREPEIEELKIWLLRNKQTNDWETTTATASSCYALLLHGTNLLINNQGLEVKLSNTPLSELKPVDPEVGTGYVKVRFAANEIKPKFGKLEINNPNKGIAWGAAYWQYFENLDKISGTTSPLHVEKELYLKTNTNKGKELQAITAESPIRIGDEVVVRVIIKADRDYEYVHLKDMRSSGLEPTSTLSGYRYKSGFGYYESIKDASHNFFIDYLRKGTYVFEYSLRASHSGSFSNGITTIQCMYAPEFTSHSEGTRLEIDPK